MFKNFKLKIIYLFIGLFIYWAIGLFETAYAVSPTPHIIPLNEKINNQINDLKERIASRVAQLKLVERRGIIGTVIDISNTQITLSDVKEETRFIDVDELTKFSSSSSKDFGISDVNKGTKLGILGLYNKESKRMLARFVEVVSMPKFYHGVVSGVDDKNYVITIDLTDKKQISTDVQTTTKTFQYAAQDGLKKSGFSKITSGIRILVVGFADKKEKDKVIASRIIIFPELAKNPQIIGSPVPTSQPTPTETPTPSPKKK